MEWILQSRLIIDSVNCRFCKVDIAEGILLSNYWCFRVLYILLIRFGVNTVKWLILQRSFCWVNFAKLILCWSSQIIDSVDRITKAYNKIIGFAEWLVDLTLVNCRFWSEPELYFGIVHFAEIYFAKYIWHWHYQIVGYLELNCWVTILRKQYFFFYVAE